MFLILLTAFLAAVDARRLGSPSPIAQRRQTVNTTVLCSSGETATEAPFTISLNEFGVGNGTEGSQCATVTAVNDSAISWSTNWTWTGGDGVKSFSSVNLDTAIGRTVRGITNLPVRACFVLC